MTISIIDVGKISDFVEPEIRMWAEKMTKFFVLFQFNLILDQKENLQCSQ